MYAIIITHSVKIGLLRPNIYAVLAVTVKYEEMFDFGKPG